MSGAMGSHHSHRAGTTTWLTPPHIIAALGPFDLDPCAAPGWITAREHYILPQDGLALPWHGTVWLNPPYGAEAWTWLARLAEHGNGVALVFARTETAGFVEQVWSKADGVLFLHGRLHFHYPDGTRAAANSGAPSCLVAYGAEAADRLSRTDLAGSFIRLNPPLHHPACDIPECGNRRCLDCDERMTCTGPEPRACGTTCVDCRCTDDCETCRHVREDLRAELVAQIAREAS